MHCEKLPEYRIYSLINTGLTKVANERVAKMRTLRICKIVFAKYTIVILFFVNFLYNLYYRLLSLFLILSLVPNHPPSTIFGAEQSVIKAAGNFRHFHSRRKIVIAENREKSMPPRS